MPEQTGSTRRQVVKAYLALAAVSILWGLTFAGIIVAMGEKGEKFPPFFLAWLRQLLPGMFVMLWCILQKQNLPSGKVFVQLIVAALLMLVSSNVLITWSLLYIPSGLVGLLFTLLPGFTLFIEVVITRTVPFRWTGLAGISLGFAGLYAIYLQHEGSMDEPNYIAGIGLTILAVLTWAAGTIYAKRLPEKLSPWLSTGIQLVITGLFLLPISYFTEDWTLVNPDTSSWIAVIFLVISDSLLAYTAFLYALRHLSGTVVSLYSYINTLIIVLVGILYFHEYAGPLTIAGTALTLGGVYLVNKAYGLSTQKPAA
ncbi:MAG: EamA family transporter [Bacteroidota bacterium]